MAICYVDDFATALTASFNSSTQGSMFVPGADVTRIRNALYVGSEPAVAGGSHGHFVPLVIDNAGALKYVTANTTSGVNDRLSVTAIGAAINVPSGAIVRCCPLSQFAAIDYVQASGSGGSPANINIAFGMRTRVIQNGTSYTIKFPSFNSASPATQYMKNDDAPAVVEIINPYAASGTLNFPAGTVISWAGGTAQNTFASTVKVAVYTFRMAYPLDWRTTLGIHMFASVEFFS